MHEINPFLVFFIGLTISLWGLKKGNLKLKNISKSYLAYLLIKQMFYVYLWIPAILGVASLFIYLKNKFPVYKYFSVFILLFYLFGKSSILDLTISAYILLDLYNQKIKTG